MVAYSNPLVQLTKVLLLKLVPEFRLPDQDDLDELLTIRFEVRNETDLLQRGVGKVDCAAGPAQQLVAKNDRLAVAHRDHPGVRDQAAG